MPIKFRFRWIPFAAMLFAAGLGIMLGNWQAGRATEKESIARLLQARQAEPAVVLGAEAQSAGALAYRQVRVTGEFLRDWPIYLDNRPLHGKAGFYVLMPLKITGTDMHVLIMRGWLPRNPGARDAVPDIATPKGPVQIDGQVRARPGRLLELGDAVALRPGAFVQNIDAAQFGAASGLKAQPFFIQQMNDAGDGLERDWPAPSAGSDKHRGYAFQWYALAATAFLFFVVTGFRRGTR
jgi:surfeit locus 1 family protein